MESPDGNGTVDPGVGEHWYDWNSYVTLTASPGDGWEFKWWLFDGTHPYSQNPFTFPITEDVVVKAFFVEPPSPPPAMKVEMAFRLSRELALKPGEMGMQKEDYTGYTEVETGDRIQKTANHIDLLAYRNEDSYLYKDFGVGHFKDFVHDLRISIVGTAEDNWGFACWMLSNVVDDAWNAHPNISLACCWDTGDVVAFALFEWESDGTSHNTGWLSSLSFNTWYYVRIVKVGTSLKAGFYSSAALRDAGDGTDGDVGNLSLTLTVDYSMRYAYGCATRNVGDMPAPCTCDIENLAFRGVKYSLLLLV